MSQGLPPVEGFGRRFFEGESSFTRIGPGEIGGKAVGLDVIRRSVLASIDVCRFEGVEIVVPTLTVLGTGVFDAFMKRNDLYGPALSDRPDDRIALDFQKAILPSEFVGDLRALITGVHTPLAVRSSSRLEDALEHPFAGVYETKMIPNNQADIDTRFRKLVEAVKFVYSSTFFATARSYLGSIEQSLDTEKMAVIIQEVVGRRYGDRYYPNLSGVARSYNYYPSGRSRPEDGVVHLALGLGKQIVDGGVSWVYSPAAPKSPPPFKDVRDMLHNTQTGFWSVNMGRPPLPDPIRETEYLVHAGFDEAEADDSLRWIASTFDPASDRLRPGVAHDGPRVLDFAPVLAAGTLPLNDIIQALLARSEEVLQTPVEIEFAVNLDPRRAVPARFGFLQLRPMLVDDSQTEVTTEELAAPHVVVASQNVLGNGRRDGLTDVVFVRPDVFEARFTPQVALELAEVNRALVGAGRNYVLIGFGRWGSADPWLGIPVQWGSISGARVIVEATLPDMTPDLSQGSHFFHNLLGFRVLYLSVPHRGEHAIDWRWLQDQPIVEQKEFVQHVRTEQPLVVRVDGHGGRGVIERP